MDKDLVEKLLTVNVLLWVLGVTLFYRLIVPPSIAWSLFAMIGVMGLAYWFGWRKGLRKAIQLTSLFFTTLLLLEFLFYYMIFGQILVMFFLSGYVVYKFNEKLKQIS